jgi:hypothetical protein
MDTMDVIFDGVYGTQAAPLRYHMSWPSAADPFYLYNTVENNARRSYYNVNYVPTFRYDGKYIKDPSDFGTYPQWYAWFRNAVDSLSAISAPIRINLSHHMAPTGDPDSIYVQVDVIAEQAVSGNLRLRGTVEEYWIRVVGVDKFYYIFRDMYPSTDGEILPNLNAGDSLHYEYAVVYDSANYHLDRMMSTVWVQNNTGKAVLNTATAFIPDISTDVASGDAPLRLVLEQNAPNPFNPTTAIGFVLDRSGEVRLSVYSSAGRLVTDLVDGALSDGAHTVTWDGRDRFGREVGSGVYYYRLDTDVTSLTKKMILVR